MAKKRKKQKDIDDGPSPLDVILSNMRYYHGRALAAAKDSATAERLSGGIPRPDLQQVEAHWRKQAESAAVNAAPYLHAKRVPVDSKGEDVKPYVIYMPPVAATAEQWQQLYAPDHATTTH